MIVEEEEEEWEGEERKELVVSTVMGVEEKQSISWSLTIRFGGRCKER